MAPLRNIGLAFERTTNNQNIELDGEIFCENREAFAH